MPRGGEGHTHSRLCAYSPDGATDYRRGQATRSPRSRDPQQITPPWGGAGVGQFIIQHSSFIIGSGVGGGWPGVTLRSPPSVICRPLGASLERQAQIRVLRDKETEETKGHLRAPACYLSFLVYLFKSSQP